MRRSVATVLSVLLVAAPALADTPASADGTAAKAKTKKVCRADVSGNPLFPTMKCHVVQVETARADEPAAPPKPATQVALAPEAAPR